jgi:hypothetical protein
MHMFHRRFAVNLINFIIITLIYYIAKQRVCETISIIKMLTISKNLVRPPNTENENKRCKIFNKVLNMNWNYVRGKKKTKGK